MSSIDKNNYGKYYSSVKDKTIIYIYIKMDSVTLLGEFLKKIIGITCFLCYNVINPKTYA